MHPLAIVFLCVTVFFFLLSVYLAFILAMLSSSPKKGECQHIAKTLGYLKKIKTKKNVKMGGYRGIPYQFAKRLSYGTYFYYVNQKTYKISAIKDTSRRQMPSTAMIVYNKRLPFHARMEDDLAVREIRALFFSLLFFGVALLVFLLII